ncbi:hypothetical protein BDC45DRAFT_533155 [Circinella umbellata]|nr:hypothetical protein BDC45DRAFT_533155 [Circinella umbellata]
MSFMDLLLLSCVFFPVTTGGFSFFFYIHNEVHNKVAATKGIEVLFIKDIQYIDMQFDKYVVKKKRSHKEDGILAGPLDPLLVFIAHIQKFTAFTKSFWNSGLTTSSFEIPLFFAYCPGSTCTLPVSIDL